MIEEKIRSAATALTTLAGDISEEQWMLVSRIKNELLDAAEQVKAYENSPCPATADYEHMDGQAHV